MKKKGKLCMSQGYVIILVGAIPIQLYINAHTMSTNTTGT